MIDLIIEIIEMKIEKVIKIITVITVLINMVRIKIECKTNDETNKIK